MTDFQHEVRAPFLPARLVRIVMGMLARLASGRGLDARYRQLRTAAPLLPAGARTGAGLPAPAEEADLWWPSRSSAWSSDTGVLRATR